MSRTLVRNKTPEDTNTRMCRLLRRMPMIPPGKIEDVEVVISTIKAGVPIDLVSMRNAILMGKRPVSLRFSSDVITNALKYEGGTWMSTVPCELWQMDDAVQYLHGNTLIGGLGLGVAPTYATYNRRVKGITVVENDQRIIDLVWPNLCRMALRKEYRRVVRADLFQFLKDCQPGSYDSGFFDIWQGTGEFTWKEHVVPLRRLARGKVREVHCWLEDEMHGQLYPPLAFSLALPSDTGIPDYSRAFSDVVRPLLPDVPRLSIDDLRPGTPDAGLSLIKHREGLQTRLDVRSWVARYLDVSSNDWERVFGESWDRCVKVRNNDRSG